MQDIIGQVQQRGACYDGIYLLLMRLKIKIYIIPACAVKIGGRRIYFKHFVCGLKLFPVVLWTQRSGAAALRGVSTQLFENPPSNWGSNRRLITVQSGTDPLVAVKLLSSLSLEMKYIWILDF